MDQPLCIEIKGIVGSSPHCETGGLFSKTFWFEASLYMFLIFWNFRGSFLSLIFGFWKFWNCILNQNSHFWGVCLIKLFDLTPPYICFWFFLNFRGPFLSLIFGFWKFRNCILNQNSDFWGVFLIKLFDLRPPYICFWFFRTLGGLFWVWFLVFENSEMTVWSVLSRRFHRHLKIWNPSIIGHFRRVYLYFSPGTLSSTFHQISNLVQK